MHDIILIMEFTVLYLCAYSRTVNMTEQKQMIMYDRNYCGSQVKSGHVLDVFTNHALYVIHVLKVKGTV